MQRTALVMIAIWLAGTSGLAAQGLPEGTFASSKEGCAKLKTKTPAELGKGLDFMLLSKTGFTGYQQRCDFVNVTARNVTSWVATAYCEEQGYAYPDLFAIAEKEGGNLSVTRLASQQDSYEGAADDDSELADQDSDSSEVDADKKAGTSGDQASAEGQAADDLNIYVRCDSVKQ